jgi:hypothetical protein
VTTGDDFLDSLITENKTWYTIKLTTRVTAAIHEVVAQRRNSRLSNPLGAGWGVGGSGGGMQQTMFWNKRGIILMHVLEWRHMINSTCYVKTVKNLKPLIARMKSEKKRKFFHQHDIAKPHNGILRREITAEFWQTVSLHLPHSPDFALSDFNEFSPLKDGLHGKQFPAAIAIIMAIE